ncbi:MAG TPA: leucyl/phenylalanyl-tRNA--protein transferase [Microthrixaceae bacterium]|nr:leucyl/phenylalanyl-tRNA--protein transferase [Microthrixaceae bacterium]
MPPCRWQIPDAAGAGEDGLVGIGADLEPSTLVAAYASSVFPMPIGRRRLGWWSPPRRGILPIDGLIQSRSLRRSVRRYETRVDTAFPAVIERCASTPRPHGWISREIITAYLRLHELGIAHSVESWDGGRLVGGLYGVSIGGLFAGESMFHDATDASKVALVRLVSELEGVPGALLDVQWTTPHLVSLGAIDVSAAEYRRRLDLALAAPTPAAFT